jgi:hypothetical protein
MFQPITALGDFDALGVFVPPSTHTIEPSGHGGGGYLRSTHLAGLSGWPEKFTCQSRRQVGSQ